VNPALRALPKHGESANGARPTTPGSPHTPLTGSLPPSADCTLRGTPMRCRQRHGAIVWLGLLDILDSMAKVFFCYARQDRATVDAAYAELVAKHDIWIDRYEIVGGESLIEKISEGIDQADKFFVFLSEVSVKRPWVQSELRSALADEIAGVRPDFVVPVLLGKLSEIPRFLKDKLYIDLSGMTQDEWVAALDAAITGTPARPEVAGSENLDVTIERGAGDHIALVTFQPRAWAETLSFIVETTEDMVPPYDGPMAITNLLDTGSGGGSIGRLDVKYQMTKRIAALAAQSKVEPGGRIAFKLEFPEGVDAVRAIGSAGRWQPA
jgi:hypothetical protein